VPARYGHLLGPVAARLSSPTHCCSTAPSHRISYDRRVIVGVINSDWLPYVVAATPYLWPLSQGWGSHLDRVA
jgi:hypothetical protein